MRFTPFALLGYLIATFLLIQHVGAAPTKPPPVQRFPGTIGSINHARPLVSVTDAANNPWGCDNGNELCKEDIKVGDEVTLTKRLLASQTAHDVQEGWSDGTITYVWKVLVNPHPKHPQPKNDNASFLSLRDRNGRVWHWDKLPYGVARTFSMGDEVRFKKSQGMSQYVSEVTKV